MMNLECFCTKDMLKSDQYDMESGTFFNWSELFVSYMMGIDRRLELIVQHLSKEGCTPEEGRHH